MSIFSKPDPPVAPTPPAAPPPPPLFGSAPQGNKPSVKSQVPSFLGAEDVAGSKNLGYKTLLGQ